MEEERRLADPGLAAEKDDRPGHEAAPEDPIQLADAGRDPWTLRLADVDQARRHGGRGPRALPHDEARRTGFRPNLGLHEAVPGRAGAALPFPAKERLAARLADEPGLGAPRCLAHRE